MVNLYLKDFYDEVLHLYELASEPDADSEAISEGTNYLIERLAEKGELAVKLVKQLEANEAEVRATGDGFKKEADFYYEKADALKHNREAILDKILRAMQVMDIDAKKGLKCGDFTLKLVGNGGVRPTKLDVKPEELPVEYQRIKIEADMAKIREHLEELELIGMAETWAHLEDRGQRLSVK